MNTVLNISTYKFVPLPDAAALREVLLGRAQALQLKGTILLAEEGINMFLAGPADDVRSFVTQLQQDPRFADIAPKESWSDTQPFIKMLVKVKGEIIRMNHPTIRPDVRGEVGRAPAVAPETLRRWRHAFLQRESEVGQLGFDTRFVRIWTFYLAYCEAAFDHGNTDVMQFTLRRPD